MTELLLTREMIIRTGSKVIASEVESKRARRASARFHAGELRKCREDFLSGEAGRA